MKRLMILGLSLAGACGMHVFGAMAFEKAASVYNAAVMKGGSPFGIVQVKVAKASAKKGAAASAKVSATVQLADSKKKISFKNGIATLDGAVTEMTAGGQTLHLTLGEDNLDGSLGDMAIVGARDLARSKDKAEKTAAAAAASAWAPGFAVAQRTDKGWNGYSVQLDKKGAKVKLAGQTAGSKKKPGGTGTFFIRDGKSIAFALYNKNAQTAFAVGGAKDGSGEVMVEGLDHATAGKIVGKAGDNVVPTAELPAGIHYGESGAPENVKVKTNPKTGEVTASFTAYQTVNGKEKKVTVKVTGMLVDGVAYANAAAGKNEPVPVTVQTKDTPPEKVFNGETKTTGGLLAPSTPEPTPQPAAVLPEWAIGTFSGKYWSDWYAADEEDTRTRCEDGDMSVTANPDGSVSIALKVVNKNGYDERLFMTADSVKVAGKLAFVAAHEGPNAYGETIDIPDSYSVDASVTFPSGRTLPIIFRVYQDLYGDATWEICAEAGTPGGCFYFEPYYKPVKDTTWAAGAFHGTAMIDSGLGVDQTLLCTVDFTVDENHVLNAVFKDASRTWTAPACQLTYVLDEDHEEYVGLIDSLTIGEKTFTDIAVSLRPLTNGSLNQGPVFFGAVCLRDDHEFYVDAYQGLWSVDNPGVTKPVIPETGITVDNFTFYPGGHVVVNLPDEPHENGGKCVYSDVCSSPVTIWCKNVDGRYLARVYYSYRWAEYNSNGDKLYHGNTNTHFDFYMPVSGELQDGDIVKPY